MDNVFFGGDGLAGQESDDFFAELDFQFAFFYFKFFDVGFMVMIPYTAAGSQFDVCNSPFTVCSVISLKKSDVIFLDGGEMRFIFRDKLRRAEDIRNDFFSVETTVTEDKPTV